jgi:ankyrin repeat protein
MMKAAESKVYNSLYDAITDGDFMRFMTLIKEHPKILQMITPFGTWLHVAASNGQLEMVKELVKRGIEINARGSIADGNALNEAASEGHHEVAKYLLEAGSEMDVSEPERNPLFGAIQSGNLDIGKLLIERGIDTKVRYTGNSMKNMDALAFAEEHEHEGFIKLLKGVG